MVERRIQAVDVVADITFIAQDEARLVVRLPAALAHRTVQTPPTLVQNHLVYLYSEGKIHLITHHTITPPSSPLTPALQGPNFIFFLAGGISSE